MAKKKLPTFLVNAIYGEGFVFKEAKPEQVGAPFSVRRWYRIDKAMKEYITTEFERLKDQEGLLNSRTFQYEVVGRSVPRSISDKIFKCFASWVHVKTLNQSQNKRIQFVNTVGTEIKKQFRPDGMDIEDLMNFYAVMSDPSSSESQDIAFELIKLNPEVDFLTRQDLDFWCKDVLGKDTKIVDNYFDMTSYDARVKITKSEFIHSFYDLGVSKLEIFSVIPNLLIPFQQKFMNMEPDDYKLKIDVKQQNQIKNQLMGGILKMMDVNQHEQDKGSHCSGHDQFSYKEKKKVKQYFMTYINGINSSDVVDIYTKLFQHVHSNKIRHFIIKQILKYKGNDAQYFEQLVENVVQISKGINHLNFWFDLCTNFKNEMFETDFIYFLDLFRLDHSLTIGIEFPIYKSAFSLKGEDAIPNQDMFRNLEDINAYQQSRYSFIGVIGLSYKGDHYEQYNAIKTMMCQHGDGELDMDQQIRDVLHLESDYYMIESKFWKAFITDIENPVKINGNEIKRMAIKENFLIKDHQLLIRDEAQLNEDYTIVPGSVYRSLDQWYPSDYDLVYETTQFIIPERPEDKKEKKENIKLEELSEKQKDQDDNLPTLPEKEANEVDVGSHHHDSEMSMSTQNFGSDIDYNPYVQSDCYYQHLDEEGKKRYDRETKESFNKEHAGVIYDLQIRQRVIYLGLVSREGEFSNFEEYCDENGIFEFERYFEETKEEGKEQKLPFVEAKFSKYATCLDIQQELCDQFKVDIEDINLTRFYIGQTAISLKYMKDSLDRQSLVTGKVVYLEVQELDNSWPTANKLQRDVINKIKEQGNEMKQFDVSQGIFNVGNSSYLSAFLQVLANTPHFHEYYSPKKKVVGYEHESENNLNPEYGNISQLMGGMINACWQKNQPVMPLVLKNKLQTLNEDLDEDNEIDIRLFIDYIIEEVMSTDTNHRIEGEFEDEDEDQSEEEEQNDQPQNPIDEATKAWNETLREEWSFYLFMLHGQMHDSYECLTCGEVQNEYGPFYDITIPMHEAEQVTLIIIVKRMNQDLKELLNRKKNNTDKHQCVEGSEKLSMNKMGQHIAQSLLGQVEEFGLKQENIIDYNKLANDQQIQIKLNVKKDILIKDIIKQIIEYPGVNINKKNLLEQKWTTLMLYTMKEIQVNGMFDPDFSLQQYKLDDNIIYAQELLNDDGEKEVCNVWKGHQALEKETNLCKYWLKEEQNQFNYDAICAKRRAEKGYTQSKHRAKDDRYSKGYIFNNQFMAATQTEMLQAEGVMPSEIIVTLYNRRWIRDEGLFIDFKPQFITGPVVTMMPLNPSGRRVYEECWIMVMALLKRDERFFGLKESEQNLWWQREDFKECIEKETGLKPFIIKYTDREGYNCPKCHWTAGCSGCIMEPAEEPIDEFIKYAYLAIEWNHDIIEKYFKTEANITLQSKLQPPTVESVNVTSLGAQIKEYFTKKNETKKTCNKCNQETTHDCKSKITRLPPILSLELDRFQIFDDEDNLRKVNSFVDFPMKNLNLRDYVEDKLFTDCQKESCYYDLFAVIHHHGTTIKYGQYIVDVMNPFSKQWHRYDHHIMTEINKYQIDKANACQLYYVRKDIPKAKIENIYPKKYGKLFNGKPVDTEKGTGYIVGAVEQSEDHNLPIEEFYVNIKGKVEVLKVEQIKKSPEKFYESAMAVHVREELKKRLKAEKLRKEKGCCSCFSSKKKDNKQVEPKESLEEQEQRNLQEENKVDLATVAAMYYWGGTYQMVNNMCLPKVDYDENGNPAGMYNPDEDDQNSEQDLMMMMFDDGSAGGEEFGDGDDDEDEEGEEEEEDEENDEDAEEDKEEGG